MSIPWLPWSAEAFARARAERKPVLLSIAATWCRWCDEMDRTSYADAAVGALIDRRFIPVRVDPDRRPDIGARYSLGGWPTTAFLTADGELLGGGTFVGEDRMASVLQQAAEAFAARNGEFPPRAADASAMDAPLPAEDAAVLERRVFETFDASTGCFGGAPAFPHAAPIRLALAVCRRDGDGRMRDVAVTALDGMGWGGLYDETEGGFFRAARGPGWQHVDLEKLLDVNAALLSVYVEAFETLGLARYRERAEGVIRYAQTVLADAAEGGWSASQRADEGYYAADDPVSRARSAAPTVDPAQYADWNAAMASAALSAARVFADDWLRDFAIKSLERLSLRCYRPGAGMAHYVEPGQEIRGLLDDQIAMIAAHLDAYETTGNIVYEMMAEELAHYAVRVLWDEDSGGFLDRTAAETADDVGLLRRRLKPFVVNCEAARALSRLAAASGDSEFARRADRTLAAMARVAPAQGPQAAHYLLALREPHLR